MNVIEYLEMRKPTLSVSEQLLLMIAKDTREMLEMARENQVAIRNMMETQNGQSTG